MADSTHFPTPASPVGIFDSGVGGLSVLRHVRALLPHEELLYFSDSGFAPYGEKPESAIVARAVAIADFFVRLKVKAIVVACNTATAAAIAALRERYPQLDVVGVEPGLKPAAALTRSGTVGVMATAGTLASDKFQRLQQQVGEATQVKFVSQPCNGLAHAIEQGDLQSTETAQLVRRYVESLLAQHADTLVLGCTHYPFVEPLVREAAGEDIRIVDTGGPVAQQLQRLLARHALLNASESGGALSAYTTGSRSTLADAFRKLLGIETTVEEVAVD